MLVDVHTHLTHEKFDLDRDQVIAQCYQDGIKNIIVNGLNPPSNRMTLALAAKYDIIHAALGIYPLDAINDMPDALPFSVVPFDVPSEIAFIKEQAQNRQILAIGECGLDGYWVDETTFPQQEKVFEALIQIALEANLPLIIHSRKREVRCMEILKSNGVTRVNFHCYGGRTKNAIKWAEELGWYFSVPANAHKSEAFKKMLKSLPEDRILTETDAPYLAPEKGARNYPGNVKGTVALLAEIRGWAYDEAVNRIAQNYNNLFVPEEPSFG